MQREHRPNERGWLERLAEMGQGFVESTNRKLQLPDQPIFEYRGGRWPESLDRTS